MAAPCLPAPSISRDDYTVGIICAVYAEYLPIHAALDDEHGEVQGDNHAYACGRMGAHNVVIAMMGEASAATVATDMMRTFPIRVALMVGVGGGVWSEQTDVRLGDVVVSQPCGMDSGVLQWDYGTTKKHGAFCIRSILNKPPRPVLDAMRSLKVRDRLDQSEVSAILAAMIAKNPMMANDGMTWRLGRPDQGHDELFEASYEHVSEGPCDKCDGSRLVRGRPPRAVDGPRIHYGNIASFKETVKHGPTRDRIAQEESILCFETEAEGLMSTFPHVVIRGVCDYADSHETARRRWRGYAAVAASAYAKILLLRVPAVDLTTTPPASEVTGRKTPSRPGQLKLD
jgi:nucleoside phosphorylase